MRLALISPPGEHAHEMATLQALLAAGLDRFHLRKPGWDAARLAVWLGALPVRWYGRVFLHDHPDLAVRLHLGGIHFRDDDARLPAPTAARSCATSRSCHDVASVKAALGHFDSVFFGPVFPSLSKPGYGPAPDATLAELRRVLSGRDPAEKRTQVFAIGGITAQHLDACRSLGFDGIALLGAVWGAADPVAAFLQIHGACRPHAQVAPSNVKVEP
jgi:thiamine-phosphate pyrophosphorylase